MSVQGISKLKANFKRLGRELLTAAHPAMLQGADDVVATARLLVPVDEGDLRATIRRSGIMKTRRRGNDMVQVLAGDQSTTVGKSKNFQLARIVEFGTTSFRAEPFMRPAMRRSRGPIVQAMRKAISDAIKKG